MPFSWFSIALPLLALAMRLASAPTVEASYLVLAVHALFGRAQAVQAIGLAWLFGMLSRGIAPETSLASIGFYLVSASATIAVFLRSGGAEGSRRISGPVLATLALGVFLVFHSILFSQLIEVSVLKAISWTAAAATLLAAWDGLSGDAHKRLEAQVFGGLIIVVAVSLPLLGTEIGYLQNDRGFQGILSHPQGFGPTMALLGAWLAGGLLIEPRPSWRHVTLLGVVFALTILSQGRTATIALILGVPAAMLFSAVMLQLPMRRLMPGLASSRVHLLVALAGASWLFVGTVLTDKVWEFLQKNSESESFMELFDVSRGGLVEAMWPNIERFPIEGIGFGVASDLSLLEVERDPFLGLPVSASIEKGVMPLAVLEELGIPGFLAVAAWLCVLLRRVASGGVAAAAVFFTALIVNLGEAILFSPRGMGLLILVLVSWASTGGGDSPRRDDTRG